MNNNWLKHNNQVYKVGDSINVISHFHVDSIPMSITLKRQLKCCSYILKKVWPRKIHTENDVVKKIVWVDMNYALTMLMKDIIPNVIGESPSGFPNEAMNQHTSTQSLGFINKLKALIKVFSYVCVFSINDYLNKKKLQQNNQVKYFSSNGQWQRRSIQISINFGLWRLKRNICLQRI